MKPLGGISAWAATCLVLTVGCNHQESNHATSVASELMMRLITADTLQRYDLVAGEADWRECEWVWSSDITRPVGTAKVIDQSQTGSLVETRVEYTVLGRARAGELGARFVHDASRDTVAIGVFVDEDGNGRFQCGDYNLNHTGMTVFLRDWVPLLDSASLDEWNAALVELER